MVFILYELYFLSPYTYPTPKPTPYTKISPFLDFQKKQDKKQEATFTL